MQTIDDRMKPFKQEFLLGLQEDAKNISRRGNLLLRAKTELGEKEGWPKFQSWLIDTCNFTLADTEFAIDIHLGKINIQLAHCGVPAEKLRRVSPEQQAQLCNNFKWAIKQDDKSIIEKTFDEMKVSERNQLINRAGRILPPNEQVVKKPKRAGGPKDNEADEVEFDGTYLRLKAGTLWIKIHRNDLKDGLEPDGKFDMFLSRLHEMQKVVK